VGVEELLVSGVSWVGISVALVCLAGCLTTLCCQGAPWHSDHSNIHCNLWANLLITELLFLVGANKTQFTVSAAPHASEHGAVVWGRGRGRYH
jgi:H+/Cl- antiporter ClcA